MEESFKIEVQIDGRQFSFEGRLATVGYTHRFYVMINSTEVTYEPDEERNYRAILSDTSKLTDLDRMLIQAVGDKIQEVFQG